MSLPRPLGAQVLIKMQKQPMKTSLILPDSISRPSEGDADTDFIVVRLGSECKTELKIGHKVCFRQGTQLLGIVGTEFYVVPEASISCVLNEDEVN